MREFSESRLASGAGKLWDLGTRPEFLDAVSDGSVPAKGSAAEDVVRLLASVDDEEERDEENTGKWEEEVTQRIRREPGNDAWE